MIFKTFGLERCHRPLLAVIVCLLFLFTQIFTVPPAQASEGRAFDVPGRVNPHRGNEPVVYVTGPGEGESASSNALYRLEAYPESVSVFRKSDNTRLLNIGLSGSGNFWGFSPDEHRFFIYYYDGTKHNAQLYNLKDAQPDANPVWPAPGSPDSSGWTLSESRVTFSRNGQYLFFAALNGTQVTLRVVEAATGTVRHAQNYSGADSGWGFSPDEDRFVIHYYDGTTHQVRLYNLEGSQQDTPPVWSSNLNLGAGASSAFSFSRNGKYLFYAALSGTNHLYMWVVDAVTGSESYSVDFNIGQQAGLEGDRIGSATWGFDRQENTFIYAYYNVGGQVEWQPVRLPEGEHITTESPFSTAYARWRTCYYGEAIGIFSWTATQTQVRLIRISDGASLYNTYHSGQTEDVQFRTTDEWFIAIIDGVQYNLAPREGDPPEAPAWPAGSELTFSNIEPNSLTVSWPEAVDDEAVTGYRLFRDGALVATVGANVLSRSVTGLSPETEYTFGVEARNAEGLWSESLEGAVTTSLEPGPPAWPAESELVFSDVEPRALTVTWPEAEDKVEITGYRLFKDGEEIAVLEGDILSHTVEDLEPNTEYLFGVEAVNVEGLWSDRLEGTVTTSPEPPGWPEDSELSFSDVGLDSLTVSWPEAVDDDAVTGYRLFKDGEEIADLDGGVLSHAVDGLEKDTEYLFGVEAVNAEGLWSDRLEGNITTLSDRAFVSTAEQLQAALEDPIIVTIIFENDITDHIALDRLVNLDFSTYTLTGNVSLDTNQAGGASFDGTASPAVSGEMVIKAPAATVFNSMLVGGEITVTAVEAWVEDADNNDLVIDIENGPAMVFINGALNRLTVNSSGDELHIIVYGSVQEAFFNAPAIVYGGDNIVTVHINSVDVTIQGFFAGGDGTPGDPYQVDTAIGLSHLRQYLGPEHTDTHFVLTADINLGVSPWHLAAGWKPIGYGGSSDTAFQGILDGNDKVIRGLYINRPEENYVGFFGYVEGASIEGVTLNAIRVKGNNYVGGLVGGSYRGSITDSHFDGVIIGQNAVGGLVGYNRISNIEQCSARGDLTGNSDLGGLVGLSDGIYGEHSIIKNSHARVNVNGGCDRVGGLVGWTWNSDIKRCYATGEVEGSWWVGGLIGWARGDINESYATGDVYQTGDRLGAGGLVGRNGGSIENCYAINAVHGPDPVWIHHGDGIGGLVGFNSRHASIRNCYSVGPVYGVSWETTRTGGLVGFRDYDSVIAYSYYDKDISGQSNTLGIPKSTAEMTTYPGHESTTYVGWDFDLIWGMSSGQNSGYPFLRWLDVEPETYEVTFSVVGANGTLTAAVDGSAIYSGAEVAEGKDVVFTAAPDQDYRVKEWRVNGEVAEDQVEDTLTLENLQEAVAVTVEFALIPSYTYTITLSVEPEEGGTVTGDGEYEEGKEVTVTATAHEGYEFANWTEEGTQVSSAAEYTFMVEADRILVAHFIATATFTDVSPDHPFFEEIEKLVALEIATGWPDGTFRPTLPVTRMAMAAFLYRAFDLEDPGVMEPSFTDVPEDHTFFIEIEALAATGITTGWPDGTFRPTLPVTRQAAAAFLFRALELEDPGVIEPTFSDVPPEHPFFVEIEALAATGITTGWPDGTFRPTLAVTRQAMAAFLIRALELDDQ